MQDHFKPALPLLGSFWRAWRYHVGSAIYGGAIIAIIRLIRYIMMYIDRKTAELQQSNKAVKILMIGVQCCLWCLEKVARYISNAAYIMIAIEGRGFCASAWRSFKLLFSNSLRIATTEVIAMLVLTLSTIGTAPPFERTVHLLSRAHHASALRGRYFPGLHGGHDHGTEADAAVHVRGAGAG